MLLEDDVLLTVNILTAAAIKKELDVTGTEPFTPSS